MKHAGRRRTVAVGIMALAAALLVAPAPTLAHEGHDHASQEHADQGGAASAAATLPTGFADVEVITGISEATTVAFAPDGTAFVALKTGLVKSFDYDAATEEFEPNDTSTDFADLRTNVENYWDRGLTGIAVDPQFGSPGHNYVYVSYTYNRDPRDNPPVVPKWGDPAEAYDECPEPASTNPVQAGCVVMMRVSRVTAERGSLGWTMVPGSEVELMASGCFQFGSHASGDVVFGPDGDLYASGGDGASFDTNDYGQYANPCGDPTDEGGALRAQDVRSTGDPLGVGGSVVRIDPAAGLTPSQATADDWLVAYGQRNPWRLTFRPGTDQLWSGDVGASAWEEVNRLDGATTSRTPVNRGWPCYEGSYTGSQRNPGWDVLDKPLCESLYAAGPSAVAAPYFSYQTRGPKLTSGEDCRNSTSSVSGVAFTGSDAQTDYPKDYQDSLFFSDYARSCVWRLGKLPNGEPDPTTIVPFVQMAETPVQLKTGPGGDLYYVDYGLDAQGGVIPGAAGVHRIVYTGGNAVPTAQITADKTSGPAPLTVAFSGTSSTDPDGDPLTYAWDLDGDGAYDDSTSPTPSSTFAAGTHTIGLRVDDGQGHTATTSLQIQSGNTAPVLGTVTPTSSLTWAVGDDIAFSATATDAQDGTLPASAFSWGLAIRHCPGSVCHSHPLGSFPGTASGSFQAPDHEYPSHLLLTVSVTDSGGLTTSRDIRLDPATVDLTFASTPAGAPVTVNTATHATPHAETFIQGSRVTITAAETYTDAAGVHTFSAWSDGGGRSHELDAPSAATTYTASYTLTGPAPANTAPTMTRVTTYPAGGFYVGQTLGFDALATDPDEELADSAYSFVMERADCAIGCPRQVVQRWTGVRTGQYAVPPMPYPSRLFLTATATDAQGATASRTLEVAPQPATLRVDTRRKRLKVRVDGDKQKGGSETTHVVGSTVRLKAPKKQRKQGATWVFVRWSDGGARSHDVVVGDTGLTVKAVYRRKR